MQEIRVKVLGGIPEDVECSSGHYLGRHEQAAPRSQAWERGLTILTLRQRSYFKTLSKHLL